ncbi:hypothetical protein [Sulfuricurvum sp.]|nr:hypothetical protein [Sulfuricurvum sp.]MDD2267809.1 hypothetical protein [Sulfuricurvum sp.]MDD2783499.1 hypothetical protein [Sulfuricurvum sp.]HZF70788.1 hypothetical protein [Sulfuricurvum sp.]
MKKLTLILLCGVASMALSADEYTIQTISALKESSITPAFEKKVQKTALPSAQKKEGQCNIVTVGEYPTAKKAHADLSKAKRVAKDAFIRPVNRNTPKVCEAKEGDHKVAMVEDNASVVSAKSVVPKKEETAVVKKEEASAHPSVVQPMAKETVSPSPSVAIAEIAAAEKSGEKSEPCKAQPCKNVSSTVYIYDRNIGRKSDISEAIEFYKNSPYYSFRPVALQR